MLKYHTIDTSCRVIPSEVSLIFNITGCTIKCPGCFERTLWKDKGTPLTFNEVRAILNNYSCAVSCVCFMGGEHEPDEINTLARFVKHNYPSLRTAWYSGLNKIPAEIEYCNFDYLKTGPYEASKGALGTPGTNQRVFMVAEDCSLTDITDKYIRTEPDEVRQLEDIIKQEEIVEDVINDSEDDNQSQIDDDNSSDYLYEDFNTNDVSPLDSDNYVEQIIQSTDDNSYEDNDDDNETINNTPTPPHTGVIMEI